MCVLVQKMECSRGFPGGTVVRNPPDAEHARDVGLIPGSGISLGGGKATRSSLLAWEIPCTEETGGPWSMGSQRVRHD